MRVERLRRADLGGLVQHQQSDARAGGVAERARAPGPLVRAALAERPEVPVRGVLCFVDADWPLLGGAFTVDDVAVMWPKKLKAVLTEPGPLDEAQIADLQWQLHEAFPRQKQTPLGE